MTPRNEVIQIKVDSEEKGRLRTFAGERHETLSGYVRKAALSFPEYGKTSAAYDERPPVNLEKERKLNENDPSNLNATLNEKGSVVAKPSTADVVAPVVKKAISEQELRAKAMELVRTKGLSFRVAIAEVRRDG